MVSNPSLGAPLPSPAERLHRQVQILRELNHPNVVNIYQFYPKDPAYYYVVLEYLLGGELFDRIVKKVKKISSYFDTI